MPDSTEATLPGAPRKMRRRNYQACLECKKQKVKCQLGNSETPQPPCSRCRRARLDCIFGPARQIRARTDRSRGSPSNRGGDNLTVASIEEGEHPPTQRSDNEANCTSISHGPLDAGERAPHSATESAMVYNLSAWMRFPMCRDGCLSPREADHLVGYFFQQLHPFFPLVDCKYSSPVWWEELLAEETLLCATILTIAARYTWYRASSSCSRAVEIHGMMYRHVQSVIQSFMWSSAHPCSRNTTVLGVIESIMLLVEWHPRPLDVTPPPREMSGEYPLRPYGFDPTTAKSSMEAEVQKQYELFKSFSLTSWRLLGPAISLADEIGLHQIVTQSKENELRDSPHVARRVHVRDLFVSLVFGKTVPLGRKCLLTHPTRPSGSAGANPYEGLLESWSELYRLVRLIDSTLYPSAGMTVDIISSERYQLIVDDFSGLLASWRTRFERTTGSATFAKYIDVIAHSSRCWLHGVALQALVRRCRISTRGGRNAENGENFPAISLQDCMQSERSRRDLEMVDEMVNESKCTLEIVLGLHREGSLRHAPLNILGNIASTTTVLLRVQRFPLRTTNGSIALVLQVANALEEAGVDDAHAISRYASCLRTLIRFAEIDTGSTSNQVDPAMETSVPNVSSFATASDTSYALEGIDPALMTAPFAFLFDDPLMFIPADDEHQWMNL